MTTDNSATDPALFARAQRGDPVAQLLLAQHHSAQGQAELALDWLTRSIAQNHGDAIHTLAHWHILGHLVAKDRRQAADLLRRGAELGHSGCRNFLSVNYALGLGVERSWRQAVQLIIDGAVRNKDPQALRQLAVLLELTGRRQQHAQRLLFQAVIYGDVPARYLMAMRMLRGEVAGFGAPMAYLLMQDAARLGLGLANDALQTIPHDPAATTGQFGDEWAGRNWASLPEIESCRSVLLDGIKFPEAHGERISSSPDARVFRRCLSDELCDYVKILAYPRLRHSSTVDTRTGQLVRSRYRTSSSMAFPPVLLDIVVHCINLRYAQILDLAPETGETLSVLRYRPGEEYKAHSDYFVMGPEGREELERNGQRIHTLFCVLEPASEGGGTTFPRADLTVRLGKGEALHFRNVQDDGEPDPMSIHQGDRVDRGEKWLAVKWFRARDYAL